MTLRQKTAQKAWADAHRAYRNAERGERNMTRRALTDAATEVLRADIEARRGRQLRRAA